MNTFQQISKFGKYLLLFNIIVLSFAGILASTRIQSIQTQEVYFNPSQVDDWTIEDPTILLNGRIYFPASFSAASKYPIVLLFHGATRTLEDNDYIARILVNMGIIAFAISFRGHGNSTGFFDKNDGAHYNITFGDALGTYRYARNLSYIDPYRMISYGISLGGGSSIFLALSGLVPKFVVAFPALAYIMGTTPLYLHNSTDPDFEGFIMAGTADDCTRCAPEFVNIFTRNNPSIELIWFQGATHTDSRFWLESIELSLDWISKTWQINRPSILQDWYTSGILSIGLILIVVSTDIFALIIKLVKIRKLKTNSV